MKQKVVIQYHLRQSEVNRMLGKVDEFVFTRRLRYVLFRFIHGENVKVIDGPFNGFDGTIEKINEEKENLKLWLKYLVRKTPIRT